MRKKTMFKILKKEIDGLNKCVQKQNHQHDYLRLKFEASKEDFEDFINQMNNLEQELKRQNEYIVKLVEEGKITEISLRNINGRILELQKENKDLKTRVEKLEKK